jgi:hypothetical protein
VGKLRKENDMKRYAIVYLTEGGSAKLLTVDAIDESDARRQFWELYAGLGFTIKYVAQI